MNLMKERMVYRPISRHFEEFEYFVLGKSICKKYLFNIGSHINLGSTVILVMVKSSKLFNIGFNSCLVWEKQVAR